MLTLPPLPSSSGSYRWLYADVSAGPFSAVFIFMIGSVFSPRYSLSAGKGGLPVEHCAVNFVLYERGARWLWVLTEYPGCTVEGERSWRIGGSQLSYQPDGSLLIHVRDRTATGGTPTEARLRMWPEVAPHPDVQVIDGLPHFWSPLAVRARAELEVPSHGLKLAGHGYHDGNHGEELLGGSLQGWTWSRRHEPDSTTVTYRPVGGPAFQLSASAQKVSLIRPFDEPPPATSWSRWGLKVPRALDLLEASPFYARLENAHGGQHVMAEVANFARFHTPISRWMAGYRTRVEAPQ